MNIRLARLISDGFFGGMKEIPIDMDCFHHTTLVVKAYRTDSITVGGEEAEKLSLHCAMLVPFETWPHDRTTYSMQPMHVNKKGQPYRWLEFTLTAQEDPEDGYRSSLDKMFVSEPPTYHGGWTPITPTEVEVKIVEEMAFFNLAQCPEGHDGTPLALVEMGTLRHDEYYPTCRLNVNISVIPENAPRKQVLNVDAVIAASTTSEKNPGWGDF